MRALMVSLVLLAGCGTTGTPASPPSTGSMPNTAEEATAQDTCGASRFRNLIGTDASAIDVSSLPARTRIIRPGMMVTMDFSATRLNIQVAPDGKVTTLRCF